MPESIGRYVPLRILGRGGMGVVYEARDMSFQRVALKTVKVATASDLLAIRREIRALASIRHPGIVRILDHGVVDGMPWYAMELLEGTSLRKHVLDCSPADDRATGRLETSAGGSQALDPSGRPLAPARGVSPERLGDALTIARRLCGALAYMHGEGIVHRDLKPDNVLVLPELLPVLVDFGLMARFGGTIARDRLFETGDVVGTAYYMAPEQVRGDLVDARADLYSLGCVLYELLSGSPPFTGTTAPEVLWKHLSTPPPCLADFAGDVPVEVVRLVARLLEKDPRRRFGHAADVAEALAALGAAPDPRPLPVPRNYLYPPGFASREAPLARCSVFLRSTRTKGGGLLLISGESGVGKTRFALALGAEARAMGFRVTSGECAAPTGPGSSLARAPFAPFGAILQEVADRCRELGAGQTQRLLTGCGAGAAVLASMFPAIQDLPGMSRQIPADLPPDALRFHALDGLLQVIPFLSDGGPLLVLLDDLQWADELTFAFLRFFLADERRRRRLVIAGTYRKEETPGELQGIEGHVVEVPLDRLAPEGVAAMVSAMLAIADPPEALVDLVARQSEGNPFFVAEYLRSALHARYLSRDRDSRWLVALPEAPELGLPSAIADLVSLRLDRLTPSTLRTVEVAAILGREIDEDLWSRASDEDDLIPAEVELLAAQVIEEPRPGHYRFVHDKVREVAYGRLDPERRRDLHRRAAEALSASGGDPDLAVLGRHWELGGAIVAARDSYLRAAAQAVGTFAHERARDCYVAYQSLVTEPTPESVQARNDLGTRVLLVRGLTAQAEGEHLAALAESRSIGHPASEAMSLIGLAHVRTDQGRLEEAMELHREALAIHKKLGDRLSEARSLTNLGGLLHRADRGEEARAHMEAALAIHVGLGDKRGEGLALSNLVTLATDRGRPEDGLALAERSIALARETGDLAAEGRRVTNLALLHLSLGHIAESREAQVRALAIHRKVGNRQGEAVTLGALGSAAQMMGRPDEAKGFLREAIDIFREIGDSRSLGIAYSNLALEVAGEDPPEARRLLGLALEILRSVGDRRFEGYALGDLGTLLEAEERREEALALYRKAEELTRSAGDDLGAAMQARRTGALLLREGRLDEAEGDLARAEAIAAHYPSELFRILCVRVEVISARGGSTQELIARASKLLQGFDEAERPLAAEALARLAPQGPSTG